MRDDGALAGVTAPDALAGTPAPDLVAGTSATDSVAGTAAPDSDPPRDRVVRRKKLLMHVCCGPCAVWPVHAIQEEDLFDISGLFFNPNIHPTTEFERRRSTAAAFFSASGLPLQTTDDFWQDRWEEYECNPALGGKAARCAMCYRVRLDKTARVAATGGFDSFTTSLLVSPYQDHDQIVSLGREMAEQYNVEFYYQDFRPHFREGQRMAKEQGLYRQKYCGCILSLEDK